MAKNLPSLRNMPLKGKRYKIHTSGQISLPRHSMTDLGWVAGETEVEFSTDFVGGSLILRKANKK